MSDELREKTQQDDLDLIIETLHSIRGHKMASVLHHTNRGEFDQAAQAVDRMRGIESAVAVVMAVKQGEPPLTRTNEEHQEAYINLSKTHARCMELQPDKDSIEEEPRYHD